MSRIVKAKWVTESVEPFEFANIGTQNKIVKQDVKEEQAKAKAAYDQTVEGIKSANDLMKSALKSSQEIRLISKEKGYKEGFGKGHEMGLDQGLKDGAEAAAAQAEDGLNEIQELLAFLKNERQTALENRKNDMVAVAFEMATKIMKQQVRINENAIPGMLEEIILENEEGLKIYLSEYQKTLDIHIDQEISEKIRKLSKNAKVIILKEDDKIMVETKNGVVDMSLPVQLDQLGKAIGEIL
ncbi:MAG: FliH/SctL family protein [Acetobacterium sp.]